MGTIESKVLKLQEISKKPLNLNAFKQDIADILGSADMEEKKQIAEKMSKMEYENMNHARNLQFIVPHIVKESYDHNGPKGEFVIPPKAVPVEQPIAETVSEPVVGSVIQPEPKIIPNKKTEEIEDTEIVESNKIVEPIENTETKISESKKTNTPYAHKSMTGYLNQNIHEATDENRWITFKIGDPVTLINYGGKRKYCGKITWFFREENKDENETPKVYFVFTERWNKESNKRPVYIGSFEKATNEEIRTWFWMQKIRNTIRPKTKEEKIHIQEEKVKKIAEEKALLQKKIDEAEKNQKK